MKLELQDGNYLSAKTIKVGEYIVFTSMGSVAEKAYKGEKSRNKFEILVTLDGKEKTWSMSKTGMKSVIDLLGDETDKWVGKAVVLGLADVTAFGETYKTIIATAEHKGAKVIKSVQF